MDAEARTTASSVGSENEKWSRRAALGPSAAPSQSAPVQSASANGPISKVPEVVALSPLLANLVFARSERRGGTPARPRANASVTAAPAHASARSTACAQANTARRGIARMRTRRWRTHQVTVTE